MLPGGGLTQLDPALAINTAWDAWQKMLVQTLQIHGAYVGDNGGSGQFTCSQLWMDQATVFLLVHLAVLDLFRILG